ncbi:hypothetical protein vseg_014250 [Gypsophila vaccaria]
MEDPSQFCAATLSCLSTIVYDVCYRSGAKFAALSSPGCIIYVIEASKGLHNLVRSPIEAANLPFLRSWYDPISLLTGH